MADLTPNQHRWKFFRAGGFDQVRLDTGADVAALGALDQKLWVALACPTRGLEFDTATLDLIDTDKDQRIRVPEILAAVEWAGKRLRSPESLVEGSGKDSLPLDAINVSVPEGMLLLASAREILVNLGKPNATEISLDDTKDTAAIFSAAKFNGDGLVPADSAEDEAVQAIIKDVVECMGGEADRSGKAGVSQAKVDQFFADAEAFVASWARAETEREALLPLGDDTAAAAAAVEAVRVKVDDYFARCRLAAFDPRSTSHLNRDDKDYVALAAMDLAPGTPEVAGFPLARVEAGRALPLDGGLNPAWAEPMAKLRAAALGPILGEHAELTAQAWERVKEKLAAHAAWSAQKPGASVEKLGLDRVREILELGKKAELDALIAKDKALEPEANAIAEVDKLVRLHRDLYRLLLNFVCFRDFYGRDRKAIFQIGTLFIDGKSCDLCLPVEDAARHASMAGLAATYLLYCDCVRKATGEKLQIVAAVTAGDTGDLIVGRNGVFYDRKGRDFDATITKIVENPISLRQAFWLPYKKLARTIEEQVAKRAAAAEAESAAKMTALAATAAHADKPAASPAPAAPPKKLDVGVVAALGVALGAIGTAISAFATGLMSLPAWQIPLVFAGLMLLVSGPSMLIAFLKLRRRNLAPVLDANGWAVNTRARMNIPFGTTLTDLAKLPAGSERALTDPYAEKKSRWPAILVTLVVLFLVYKLLDNKGKIYEWTKGWIGTPSPSAAAAAAAAAGAAAAAEAAKAEEKEEAKKRKAEGKK